MILVELVSVANWWVRQEAVPGATLKKNGTHHFRADMCKNITAALYGEMVYPSSLENTVTLLVFGRCQF